MSAGPPGSSRDRGLLGTGPRSIQFSGTEIRDLFAAWVALGIAFAFFLGGGVGSIGTGRFLPLLVVSFVAAGIGFLLHEIAHKVVAVKFGQIAEFRADYSMLLLAIASGLAGFLFAAPGAVHHRGRITKRQNGLISVAGPVTNLALVVLFVPLLLIPVDLVAMIGVYGVLINAFLAAFNMIPFGPLDGKTVLQWNRSVFALVLGVSVAVTAVAFFTLFL